MVAVVAATLLVGGVITWMTLDQAAQSTTIPASFDGKWRGTDANGWVHTATLGKDLHLAQLVTEPDAACTTGTLTVSEATDSQLTMRITPQSQGCKPRTVVFTHLSGGDLKMAAQQGSDVSLQPPFEVRMTRQG